MMLGEARDCSETTGELGKALQTCSKVEQAIGALGKRSEVMAAILKSVRSSGDPWNRVLLPERRFQSLTWSEKKR